MPQQVAPPPTPGYSVLVLQGLGDTRRIARHVEAANRGDSVQGLGASVFLRAVSRTQLSAAATSARSRFPALVEVVRPGGRWGAQRGWGAPGRGAGLSRAPLSPHPPPLRREFQSERARGLLPGRNHPARRRRVGRRHLTARPRPPRVRGGGSVCSVTNGPSRPARPLARARRGPAREHSSRRLPASRRPARSRPAVPANPRGRSWHPARRLARGGRAGRLDRGGARLAFPQVSFDMVDGDSSPACEWWFKPAKRLQTCGDRGLQTSQGDILGAPRPESARGSRTLKAEKVGLPRARAGQPGLGGLHASEVETPRIKHEGHCREPGAGARTPSAGTSARGAQPSPDGLSPGPGQATGQETSVTPWMPELRLNTFLLLFLTKGDPASRRYPVHRASAAPSSQHLPRLIVYLAEGAAWSSSVCQDLKERRKDGLDRSGLSLSDTFTQPVFTKHPLRGQGWGPEREIGVEWQQLPAHCMTAPLRTERRSRQHRLPAEKMEPPAPRGEDGVVISGGLSTADLPRSSWC
ncbi:translation initiation factor IF-2-like [Cervus canadensis]|uniref:translation initiation factor IF-2-like n=1 Tax=Cervus canadensis TaxID=1574408 RepID=UPI001CA37FF6|nr:translation initiation factor IF-2-like [Cervus canadensis]